MRFFALFSAFLLRSLQQKLPDGQQVNPYPNHASLDSTLGLSSFSPCSSHLAYKALWHGSIHNAKHLQHWEIRFIGCT